MITCPMITSMAEKVSSFPFTASPAAGDGRSIQAFVHRRQTAGETGHRQGDRPDRARQAGARPSHKNLCKAIHNTRSTGAIHCAAGGSQTSENRTQVIMI